MDNIRSWKVLMILYTLSRWVSLKQLLILALVTLLVYLPIILNPSLFLGRGNDLEEYFYPLFYYTIQSFFQNHSLPLWNNLFLSGTPLLPNPQSFLFYPPNIIFFVFPLNFAFIFSALLHTFFGGVGTYLAARWALKYSEPASLFSALVYLTTPKLFGYIEAGHFGLLTSFTFLPFAFMFTLMLARSPKLRWAILLGVSLAGLFYTHTIIFLLASFAATLVFIYSRVALFLVSGLLSLGLSAISLLPQLEWIPQTTRYLLLQDRDIYPKWTSISEFLKITFFPWVFGIDGLMSLDSEKWISMGTSINLMAIIGFVFLGKKLKSYVFILVGTVIFIVLNNVSPIESFLLSQDWFLLARVSTRFLSLLTILAIFLSGFAFEKLKEKFNKTQLVLILLFVVVESLSLSWIRLYKPIIKDLNAAPQQVYDFLKQDSELFRVFCVNRCLSQKESALQKLELVEGYDTIQQKNYYQQAWQLTQSYWNYYTLSIPPIGLYQFKEIQPDAKSLGFYNTKYIISPHQLKDTNFNLKKEINGYLIYENKLYLPRAYFLTDDLKPNLGAIITYYSPNRVVVNTTAMGGRRLVLAQVYNKGWSAYLNGKEKVLVQEKPDALTQVDINSNTQFVEFKFQPESFKLGAFITVMTAISGAFLFKLKK